MFTILFWQQLFSQHIEVPVKTDVKVARVQMQSYLRGKEQVAALSGECRCYLFLLHRVTGMEVCPLRYRATFGVMVALPYAVMLIMLAGISYLSRQWVSTQLWGSVPVFVLCICSSPL